MEIRLTSMSKVVAAVYQLDTLYAKFNKLLRQIHVHDIYTL